MTRVWCSNRGWYVQDHAACAHCARWHFCSPRHPSGLARATPARANVRTRLETDASRALACSAVGGRVALRFFPLLHVTLEESHSQSRRGHRLIGEVQLGIELRSLLHKDLEFRSVQFKGAQITIERNKSGELNIDRPPSTDSARQPPTSRESALPTRPHLHRHAARQ